MPITEKQITQAIARWDKARTAERIAVENFVNSRPPPELVYHYTDWAGLQGILRSGELWCSDIFSLNDPSEVRFAVDKGLERIAAMARRYDGVEGYIGRRVVRDVKAHIETLAHPFICSLSCTDNDIGQWRAYADDGRGYALAFDAKLLDKAFMLWGKGDGVSGTFKVLYDDRRLVQFHNKLDKLATPTVKLVAEAGRPAEAIIRELIAVLMGYAETCVSTAVLFKHSAYDSEEEFRLFRAFASGMVPKTVEYRERPYALVKYIKFGWRALAPAALKGIVIGPAADLKEAGRFAMDCLSAYEHLGVVNIRKSEIPYRRTKT